MPLFVTSSSQAKTHGVYAIERTPPSVIRAQGLGVVGIAEQFPWGPEELTEVPDFKTFVDTYAPYGSSHTGAGYLAVAGKSWPVLRVVRVLGPTAAAATATINKTGPTAMLTLTLKYKGVLGNSVTATISAASDGDANHFNLTVSLTGASGTTTDRFENLNYSGVGADSVPDFSRTLLIASITEVSSGVPLTGTTSFTGGTDGTVTSADYVGTQGAADKGISLFEGDKTIDFVITGDPGNSLRAAVNAGLVAHADYTTDRMAFINGNSALTIAAVRTDVASYRSIRCCYIDNWAYMRDDVDGTERITAPAPWAASVAASLSPSTSFAWKASSVRALLRNVTKLETQRGDAAGVNTDHGICTFIKEAAGGFTFESAVNTYAPVNPAKRTYKRTRMGHYLGKAVIGSLRESVDSPNVPLNQQDEVNAVADFGNGLVENSKTDPNNLPHLLAFSIDNLAAFNTTVSLAAGEFTIPASAQISPDQEKIFLSLNYGESVKVTVDL
jgi:hypothetical protein